ncbi:MAG: transporter [candidate division NC10 bacterium]|nr:transporter [candidate division NC10 bacterium]
MMARVLVTLLLVATAVPAAHALDHKNLDEGRPLRLEDAYPVASGELALEVGAGFVVERRSADRGVFAAEILYGAFPNFQVGLGTELSTDPREIDKPIKSGDLQLSGLYNFNQETLSLPALAAKLTLNFPTGVDSSGIDVELKAIGTKSFDRLSLHLNVAYAFLSGTKARERDGRYAIDLGASYPIGAPRYTRTTLVGNLFTEQSAGRDESNAFGAEAGFRHQLTARTVLDAGLGSEFAGPGERSIFYVTAGLSMSF